MTTWVKICGLTDAASVSAALDAGADAVGFVLFVPRSPRNVARTAFLNLARRARRRVKTVAVTADASRAQLDDILCGLEPDVIQLHGHETPEDVRRLRVDFGLDRAGSDSREIWKALPVSAADDLARAIEFDAADRILLDARPPLGAHRTGGHGRAFKWELLEGWTAPKPWVLSGGLSPSNVAEAVARSGAVAVDVSSGVESSLGVKDPAKIAAFIAAAKAASPAGALA
jgi:phosphoribosylanthranilate isomerase